MSVPGTDGPDPAEDSGPIDRGSHPNQPEPPEGYRDPVEISYSPLGLFVGSVVLFGLAVAVFGAAMEALRTETSFEFGVGPLGLAAMILVFAVTIVAHELLHGLAYRLLGYRVQYGLALNVGAAYTAAFGQFQTRRDGLVAAVAPLAVFTVVLTPLLAGPPAVALAAFFVLVVNTSGAVGDLYLVYRLLRMPLGTLLYDADARRSYVFYPE